jgi:glycosyltransferase involved in cell wall biosynthesis
MERADAVTAVSRALLDDTKVLYPCIANKGHVIYNGVGRRWLDSSNDASSECQKYILYVGRFHEVKGVDVLLQAWSKLSSRLPTRQLWLVGAGPEEEKLRHLVQELRISASVRFKGQMNAAELIPLYKNAELFILPSHREGFPFTLLEASACGTVCVATRIPGIVELIEDQATGFLVTPEDIQELASTILRVLQLDPKVKERIIEAAKCKVLKHYSEDRMTTSYLNLFESLK